MGVGLKVMKKTYIAPELKEQLMETQNIIALSLRGTADDSDALVKGSDNWDIWGEDANDIDE